MTCTCILGNDPAVATTGIMFCPIHKDEAATKVVAHVGSYAPPPCVPPTHSPTVRRDVYDRILEALKDSSFEHVCHLYSGDQGLEKMYIAQANAISKLVVELTGGH